MHRGRKLILLAHCLLNANAKVEGLALYKGCLPELVSFLASTEIAIYQLPCPELTSHGLNRWGQTIEQYDNPFYHHHCAKLAENVIREIKEYYQNGYKILGVIGLDGSPSCGVDITCSGDWKGNPENKPYQMVKGSGIFMQHLKSQAQKEKILLPCKGIDEENPSSSMAEIKQFIQNRYKEE